MGDRRLASAFCHQPRHASGAVVAGTSREAGVDDDADAVERQAGLGDAGRENDLPAAVGLGEDRGALGCGIKAAVEFVEDDVVGQIGEAVGGAFDLRDAGEEGEHAAIRFAERAADGGRDRVLDAEFGLAADVAEGQGIAAAFAFDDGSAIHERREPCAVERCGHRDDAEVGAKAGLHVERQREAEIAVEAAFVDFVEQDCGDAGELGIGLDARDEDAFGDHRHAGGGGALAVHAGRVAERLADGFASGRGHAFGGGAGGEAAGGEEKDLAGAPGFGEEGRRYCRGLAGTWGSDEDRRRAVAEGGEEVGEDG